MLLNLIQGIASYFAKPTSPDWLRRPKGYEGLVLLRQGFVGQGGIALSAIALATAERDSRD